MRKYVFRPSASSPPIALKYDVDFHRKKLQNQNQQFPSKFKFIKSASFFGLNWLLIAHSTADSWCLFNLVGHISLRFNFKLSDSFQIWYSMSFFLSVFVQRVQVKRALTNHVQLKERIKVVVANIYECCMRFKYFLQARGMFFSVGILPHGTKNVLVFLNQNIGRMFRLICYEIIRLSNKKLFLVKFRKWYVH